jgi:hypothetical protein
VDALGKEAYPDRYGIALDPDGNPYISYFDERGGILKVAHRRDGKWLAEVLDQNFAGFTSSLAIDHGTVWVSYADKLGAALKVASRPLEAMPAPPSPPNLVSATKAK